MSAQTLQLTRPLSTRVGMLVRRPPETVFEALADPALTTRIWFTRSSGRVVAGARLRWEWEMYGASADISVLDVEENHRIRFTWSGHDPEHPTTVEVRFIPWKEDSTFVHVTESGFTGDGDKQAARLADSTHGFTSLLASLKALVEQGVELNLVADAHPAGLEV